MTQLKTWQKILIAICVAGIISAILLFIPSVQNLILDFGENSIVHRPLTREVWIGRFLKWGISLCFALTLSICAILLLDKQRALSIYNLVNNNKKTSWSIVIFLTIISAVLGFMVLNKGHNWGGDFSEYIANTRNLATGVYYENQPMLGYLYGVSIILLPFYLKFGMNLLMLKIPMLILYAATIFFVGLFFKKRFKGFKLLLAISVFALNPCMIGFLNNILSDYPFLFLSMVSIYCIDELYDEKNTLKQQIITAAIAGFCIGYAKICRDQSLVIILAFICTEMILVFKNIFKKPFFYRISRSLNSKGLSPHIALYIAMIVTLGVLHFFVKIGLNQTNVGSIAIFSLKTIISNVKYYAEVFKEFFYGHIFLWILCVPLLVIGLIKKYSDEIFVTIFTAGFLCLHLISNFHQGLRYMFPILPFIIMFSFYGFENLQDMLNMLKDKYYSIIKKGYVVFACFLCLIFLNTSFSQGLNNMLNHREWNHGAFSTSANEVYSYIIENTKEDDKILFVKIRALFLATFRSSHPLDNGDGDVGWRLNEDKISRNDYILFSKDYPNAMDGYETEIGKRFISVFKNDEFELYKIIK